MVSSAKSYLKFFIKVHCVARLRSLLLLFFGASINKDSWENRILVIHLEGLGDVVMLTSILKYYKKDFPGKEIYLLINKSSGVDESVFGGAIDHVVYVDFRRFVINPLYGLCLINKLRGVGFKTAITHDPGISEISGKFIALGVEAVETIGYEGALIQYKLPFDSNMARSAAYAKKNLFPRFTRIVPSVDNGVNLRFRMPNHIRHYIKSYEAVAGRAHDDYRPTLSIPPAAEESALKLLAEGRISKGKYCLLTLGTATPHREWGAEKFAKALLKIKPYKIPVVLAGGQKDAELALKFGKVYGNDFLNIIGKTSVHEYMALVRNSFFSFSNDTAPPHIAVALRKPSLAILGVGHFGMLSLYGYADINRWVYRKDAACLCDNWRCIHTVGAGDPAPCIAAISVEEVAEELRSLVEYISSTGNYPRERFRVEFT
jgi:ADP-heptose:LPS heptosyltransferase